MQPESAVARVHGEPRHGMIAREKALAKRFSGISWFLAFSSSSPREPANIVFDQGRRRKGKTTETICQTDLRVQDARRAGPARQKTPFSGLESTRMSSSTQHSGDGMFYSKIAANANATPCPFLPERPAWMSRCPQDLVSRDGRGAVLFSGAPVAADRDDRIGTAPDDRAMASSRIMGAVCSDRADRLRRGDLRQQLRQQGTVALAARSELDRAHVACASVHGDMDLPPLPPARCTVLADLPLAITAKRNAGAVDKQVQWLTGCTIRGSEPRSVPASGTTSRSPAPASRAQPSGSGSRPAQRSGETEGRTALSASGRSGWRHPRPFLEVRACRTSSRARPCGDRTGPAASR